MKKHTKIFIGLILLIAAAALSSKFYKNEKTLVFEDAYPFLDDLACVRITGKYGYINKSGEVVIQPAYDSSSFFLGGFSIQTKGKLKGCIDTNGNVVIPFEYEEIEFSNTPYFSVKKEGKYGCINTDNEIVVDFISTQPVQVYSYAEKHVVAVIHGENDKQGFVDLVTGFIVEPIYDFVSPWNNYENVVSTCLNSNYGFVNLETQTIIEPIYSQNIYFIEGLSAASQDFKSGYIDSNGTYVIEPIYEDALPFNEGIAFVKIDGKYGCINTKGEIIIEPSFAFGSSFTQGVAPVIIDENTYETVYINTNGEIVDFDEYGKSIAAMMSKYWPESASFYPSYYINKDSNQRAMAIDREGKILFKTIYDDISMPEHNMALVNLNGKVGCINEKGIEILPPLYEDIQIADENKLVIKENGKYGIIDIFRNEILPLKYDDIKSYDSKLALVKLNGKWSCLNLETNELKENVYDNVYSYLDIPFLGFPIPVQKNEVWFYIDENGEILF